LLKSNSELSSKDHIAEHKDNENHDHDEDADLDFCDQSIVSLLIFVSPSVAEPTEINLAVVRLPLRA
jgi:hypothetical protein